MLWQKYIGFATISLYSYLDIQACVFQGAHWATHELERLFCSGFRIIGIIKITCDLVFSKAITTSDTVHLLHCIGITELLPFWSYCHLYYVLIYPRTLRNVFALVLMQATSKLHEEICLLCYKSTQKSTTFVLHWFLQCAVVHCFRARQRGHFELQMHLWFSFCSFHVQWVSRVPAVIKILCSLLSSESISTSVAVQLCALHWYHKVLGHCNCAIICTECLTFPVHLETFALLFYCRQPRLLCCKWTLDYISLVAGIGFCKYTTPLFRALGLRGGVFQRGHCVWPELQMFNRCSPVTFTFQEFPGALIW